MALEVTRREFLLINTRLGAVAITWGIPWPTFPQKLPSEDRRTLLAIVRTLFPHDRANDSRYQKAVDAIHVKCGSDAQVSLAVRTGIATLEKGSGGSFADARMRTRVKLLMSVEASAFFQVVYKETLDQLYGSPDTWGIFLMDAPAAVGK